MEKVVPGDTIRPSLDDLLDRLAASPRSPVDSPERLDAAAALVAERMRSVGLEVETDPVPFRGRHFENVFGGLGEPQAAPALLVTAHHDSAPGTADPGGLEGLAVLLETARILADGRVERPLVFASYTLRNWGMAGSGRHVRQLRARPETILGAINLESVSAAARTPEPAARSRLPWRRPLGPRLVANFASRRLLRGAARGLRRHGFASFGVLQLPGRCFLLPEAREGDHARYWDAGLPAVAVTDRLRPGTPATSTRAASAGGPDITRVGALAAALAGAIRNILGESTLQPWTRRAGMRAG